MTLRARLMRVFQYNEQLQHIGVRPTTAPAVLALLTQGSMPRSDFKTFIGLNPSQASAELSSLIISAWYTVDRQRHALSSHTYQPSSRAISFRSSIGDSNSRKASHSSNPQASRSILLIQTVIATRCNPSGDEQLVPVSQRELLACSRGTAETPRGGLRQA